MVIVQNGVAKKEVIAVIFGDVPVTAADKEMKMDQFIFQGNVFRFV